MRTGIPVAHPQASQMVVDQGIATAMKLAAALQLPCCCIGIGEEYRKENGVHVRVCQNRRFCKAHRQSS